MSKIRFIVCILILVMLSSVAFAATYGEMNALSTANLYLSFSAFSRSGLIDQLQYEGYSISEANYAVDNCGANWNEQAKECAKTYLSFMAFSESGLANQLEYDGFTHSEAIYGVSHIVVDWNEQAVKSAETYLEYMSFSRSGLGVQLEYEGFNASQVEYALSIVYDKKHTTTPVPTVSPTSTPASPAQKSQDITVKSVTVPVGNYIVGEDIPAGSYTLSGDKYAVLRVYENISMQYYDDSYEVEKPNYLIGKISLMDGMMVDVVYSPIVFTTYTGIDNIDLLKTGGSISIPVGDYIIGDDIPSGAYSFTSDNYSVIRIYKNAQSAYYDDSYECEKPNYKIGKITLKDGMKIQIVYQPMVITPYSGLGF